MRSASATIAARSQAEQYWQAVARDAGTQLTPEQIEWLRRTDVAMWSNVNPADADAGPRNCAPKELQTAVLSNMHADMTKAVRAEFTWIRRLPLLCSVG